LTSGLLYRTNNFFRFRFRYAYIYQFKLALYNNSLDHYAKGTLLQNTASILRINLFHLLTPLFLIVSIIPSQYYYAIGYRVLFKLCGWFHINLIHLRTRFTYPILLHAKMNSRNIQDYHFVSLFIPK